MRFLMMELMPLIALITGVKAYLICRLSDK
jgi:hypothetical protein